MPTKRNKAGEQQNYVPAGNGDASGEYGDSATGSNKHFTAFKKPDEQEVKVEEQKGGEENIRIESNDNLKKGYKEFNEYVDSLQEDDKFKNNLKESFNAGSEESKELVNLMVSKYGVLITKETERGISNYDGAINLTEKAFVSDGFKDKGQTYYHEFFHCFDERFAKGAVDSNGKNIAKPLLNQNDYDYIKSNPKYYGWQNFLTGNLSTCKVLSNGKTLYETIQEECKKMTRSGAWDSMQKEYKKEISDIIDKEFPDYRDKNIRRAELDVELNKNAYNAVPYGEGDWNEIAEKRKKWREEHKTPEQIELEDYCANVRKREFQVTQDISSKYSSLSDMYGIYKKIPYGFCGGHIGSYGNTKGIMAHEFIAEFGSALSRNSENSKGELNLYEKYMPNSTKMCRELVDMMKKHAKEVK